MQQPMEEWQGWSSSRYSTYAVPGADAGDADGADLVSSNGIHPIQEITYVEPDVAQLFYPSEDVLTFEDEGRIPCPDRYQLVAELVTQEL
jgi:hypothetical protein